VSRIEEESADVVTYEGGEGTTKQVRGSWLVGADGKTGMVRKRFLEPIADIRQEVG
jgi:2-polyprenyl-6-methoxyphenol hydroxylase-like FAD-dependent oxidoreductase